MPYINGFRKPQNITATGFYFVGNAEVDTVSSFTVTVDNPAGGFSMIPRGRAIGSGDPTTSDRGLSYSDMETAGGQTDGTTPITAAGNYRVTADGCSVGLHVSAGTATLTIVPLKG
jgi:hypothetical protein